MSSKPAGEIDFGTCVIPMAAQALIETLGDQQPWAAPAAEAQQAEWLLEQRSHSFG